MNYHVAFAIHPDKQRFVLGTEWSIYAFNTKNEILWRFDTPTIVSTVSISGDGRNSGCGRIGMVRFAGTIWKVAGNSLHFCRLLIEPIGWLGHLMGTMRQRLVLVAYCAGM